MDVEGVTLMLAAAIIVLGGMFLILWTGASAIGLFRYRTRTNIFVAWFASMVGAGITWSFYIEWLKLVTW
jgi:hypothetical protein